MGQGGAHESSHNLHHLTLLQGIATRGTLLKSRYHEKYTLTTPKNRIPPSERRGKWSSAAVTGFALFGSGIGRIWRVWNPYWTRSKEPFAVLSDAASSYASSTYEPRLRSPPQRTMKPNSSGPRPIRLSLPRPSKSCLVSWSFSIQNKLTSPQPSA